MKKTLITVLVVVALVLALAVAGACGFLWYRNNHVFVDGDAYAIDTKQLDLRGQEISFAYYEQLKAALPGCEILWDVPFQNGKLSSDTREVSIQTLTQEDISLLMEYLPEVKTVKAMDCTEYAMLELLKAQLPQAQVEYAVSLGSTVYDPEVTELVLENGDYDYEVLLENLLYLPHVETIQLKMPELTLEQVDAIREAYPRIAVSCTVELLGQEYDVQTTELDLSAMTSGDVEDFIGKLPMLPNLSYVQLMDANGESRLEKTDVKRLQEAAPGVVFNYLFDFYGLTLSTAEEEVVVKNKKIGAEGEEEIRQTLDILNNCSRFVLDFCQVPYETLAQIREDYRDRTKVVWRVEFGEGTCLTDVEVIRCTYDLVDDNCANLIYCEDVRFMDIGHNEWLDAVPFVAGMPKLEGIIVSGAPIKDLTPFQNCTRLKFLEVAFCEYITDLTPLAGCTSLEMLNISNTHALDLSPLDQLPLKQMCARTNPSGVSRIPAEEQARFLEQHPDCWTSFSGKQPYGVGWRYDEDEITPLPYYAMLRCVFKYDESVIPNNVGWYVSEEAEAMIAALAPAGESVPEAEESVPEETLSETVEVTEAE